MFAQGGVIAALLVPAHVLVQGILGPLGIVPVADRHYDTWISILGNPIVKLYLLVLISLPFFHFAHRLRYLLVDLGVPASVPTVDVRPGVRSEETAVERRVEGGELGGVAAGDLDQGQLLLPLRGGLRFGLIRLCQRRPLDANEKSLLATLSYCFHERLRNLAPVHGFAIPPLGLTRREIDALRLIARGATDRDVAGKLGISLSTSHEHVENAKMKLNVSTRAEAVAIAVSLAIVAP